MKTRDEMIEEAAGRIADLSYDMQDTWIVSRGADIVAIYKPLAKAALIPLLDEIEMRWMPIAEAPRDGTRIICNDAPCHGEEVSIAHWVRNGWETVDLCQFGMDETVKPTLWFPILSLPPKA